MNAMTVMDHSPRIAYRWCAYSWGCIGVGLLFPSEFVSPVLIMAGIAFSFIGFGLGAYGFAVCRSGNRSVYLVPCALLLPQLALHVWIVSQSGLR